MSERFMLSAFVVLDDSFPLKCEVHGSDAVSLVLGDLPDALELSLTYDAMHQLSETCRAAITDMEARAAPEEAGATMNWPGSARVNGTSEM